MEVVLKAVLVRSGNLAPRLCVTQMFSGMELVSMKAICLVIAA